MAKNRNNKMNASQNQQYNAEFAQEVNATNNTKAANKNAVQNPQK